MAGQLFPVDISYLASAARTTLQTQADQSNPGYRGVKVIFDVTADAGAAATVTVTISGKDPASGKYYTLLAGAATTTTGTRVYTVYPGAPVTTNVSANDILPLTWRISVAVGDASPATYSIGYTLLP